jgi:hypothetical protein
MAFNAPASSLIQQVYTSSRRCPCVRDAGYTRVQPANGQRRMCSPNFCSACLATACIACLLVGALCGFGGVCSSSDDDSSPALGSSMLTLSLIFGGLLATVLWYRRRAYVFWVALQCRSDFKGARAAARKLQDPTPEELERLWDDVHERCASRMDAMVRRLGGLWVKTAQLLATRADILPDAYILRFQKCQDEMPAKGIADVRAVMTEELGGTSVDEVFAWIDPKPLASASIAQVHRAQLAGSTHREVVVKVQHRGVEELMLSDLATCTMLTNLMARLEPDMDFRPLLNAWCQEVPKELDFHIEAQNMAEVSSNLAARQRTAPREDGPFHIAVQLPKVVTEFVRRRMLVMTYEEGARLTDPKAIADSGVDIQKFIAMVARAYAQQMFADGMYNADPHRALPRPSPPHACMQACMHACFCSLAVLQARTHACC